MKYNKYDVVLVDFGEAEFAGEQGGKRPAVIIQNQFGNIFSTSTIVLPFTTKIKHINQSTHSLFQKDDENGLQRDSMLLGECIRQISEHRILKKIGVINNTYGRTEIKRVYFANFGE